MQASDAVEANPIIVHPTQTVADTVAALRANAQVRAAIVDDGGQLIGLMGLHDVLRHLLPSYVTLDPNLANALDEKYYAEHFAALAKRPVSEVMLRHFVSVPSNCSLGRAMAVMNEQQWQPLPIADQGKFAGMLTRSSVLGALAESARRLGV
jgi:CBS domain-containing protein